MDRDKELSNLMDWVSDRSRQGDILRVSDVVNYYKNEMTRHGDKRALKRKDIAEALRLHPIYMMSSSQQRAPKRSRKYRPILTNSLGNLHADLGFEPLRKNYSTPLKYRSGYLVAKDVLSRYTYLVILEGSKSAQSIIRALKELLLMHQRAFPDGHRILSLSFDQETSVMSNQVQRFLRENNISFHPFVLTSSKSKHAEGAIKLIRKTLARFEKENPGVQWWKMIDAVIDSLNSNEIVVDGKRLGYRPNEVNKYNLEDFIKRLHKAKPSYFFSQFDLDPRLVSFKFSVGDLVRPKLLVTSSAVIGEKRSAKSLEDIVFVVDKQIPYVNQAHRVGRAYRCINVESGEEEIFDEWDIALTVREKPSTLPEFVDYDPVQEGETVLPRLRPRKT
jgi:hypothetical protein